MVQGSAKALVRSLRWIVRGPAGLRECAPFLPSIHCFAVAVLRAETTTEYTHNRFGKAENCSLECTKGSLKMSCYICRHICTLSI